MGGLAVGVGGCVGLLWRLGILVMLRSGAGKDLADILHRVGLAGELEGDGQSGLVVDPPFTGADSEGAHDAQRGVGDRLVVGAGHLGDGGLQLQILGGRLPGNQTVAAVGDADQVVSLLADDVVWEGDGGGERLAWPRPVIGADRVARGWIGLMQKTTPQMEMTSRIVDLNGAPAVAVFNRDGLDRVIAFDVRDGRIAAIRAIMALDKLAPLAKALGVAVAEPLEWALDIRPAARRHDATQ